MPSVPAPRMIGLCIYTVVNSLTFIHLYDNMFSTIGLQRAKRNIQQLYRYNSIIIICRSVYSILGYINSIFIFSADFVNYILGNIAHVTDVVYVYIYIGIYLQRQCQTAKSSALYMYITYSVLAHNNSNVFTRGIYEPFSVRDLSFSFFLLPYNIQYNTFT